MNKLLMLLLIIQGITMVSANCPSGVSPCDSDIPNLVSTIAATTTFNNNSANVNSSQFLDGLQANEFWQVNNSQNYLIGSKNGSFDMATIGNVSIGTANKSYKLMVDNGNIEFKGRVGINLNGSWLWQYEGLNFLSGSTNTILSPASNFLNFISGRNNTMNNTGSSMFGTNNVVGTTGSSAFGVSNVIKYNTGSGTNFIAGFSNLMDNTQFCAIFGGANTMIGDYNFIAGGNNKINGSFNTESGFGNILIGDRNTVFGGGNRVNGSSNSVSGFLNGIDYNGSSANLLSGIDNYENGSFSFSAGASNKMNGDYQYSLGAGNLLSNLFNFGFGSGNIEDGIGDFAFGIDNYLTDATFLAYAFGNALTMTDSLQYSFGSNFTNDKPATMMVGWRDSDLGVTAPTIIINGTEVYVNKSLEVFGITGMKNNLTVSSGGNLLVDYGGDNYLKTYLRPNFAFGLPLTVLSGKSLNGLQPFFVIDNGVYIVNLTSGTNPIIQFYSDAGATNGASFTYVLSSGDLAIANAGKGNITFDSVNNYVKPTVNNTENLGSKETLWKQVWTNGLLVAGQANVSSLNVSDNLVVGGNFSAKRPYAMFSSLDTVTMAAASTPYVIPLNITEDAYLINVTGNRNISVLQTGDYLIEVSAIFSVSSPNKHVELWVQLLNGSNGSWYNVPRSNTKMELASATTEIPLAVPFIIDLNQTDKMRLMMATDNTGSQLVSTAATAYSPASPSIIVTMTKNSEIT